MIWLLLIPGLIVFNNAFDYNDLTKNWECEHSGNFLGNYNSTIHYNVPKSKLELLKPVDQWTTFPITNIDRLDHHVDDQGQLLAQDWNTSHPIGYHVKPSGSGFANRVIFQFSMNRNQPFEPPYPNSTAKPVRSFMVPRIRDVKEYQTFVDNLQKGMFNCHLKRANNYLDQVYPGFRFSVSRELAMKKRKKDYFECLETHSNCSHLRPDPDTDWALLESRAEHVPCVAGIYNPACCYATYPKLERRNYKKALGREYKYNSRQQCLRSAEFDTEDPDSYKDPSCGHPVEDNLARDFSYNTNKRPECNKHLYRSYSSCKEVRFSNNRTTREFKFFPCEGSCYDAMIVQAEILPVDSADSGDSLVHITVVARRLNGIRQPDPESRINGMAFGYDFSVDSRIEHLGIAYKDSKIKLVAGQETGLWFKWQRDGRSKMGANDTTDAFSGPVLHIGLQGSAKPSLSHDFGLTPLKSGNRTDPIGFRFGWRGIEFQDPRVSSVFSPLAVTVNTVRDGALVHYRTGFSYDACKARGLLDEQPTPGLSSATIGIMVGVAVGLFVLIIAAGIAYRAMKAKKLKKKRKKKSKGKDDLEKGSDPKAKKKDNKKEKRAEAGRKEDKGHGEKEGKDKKKQKKPKEDKKKEKKPKK